MKPVWNCNQTDKYRALVKKPIVTKWLAKISGAGEKPILGQNTSNGNTNLTKRTYNKQREIQWNNQRKNILKKSITQTQTIPPNQKKKKIENLWSKSCIALQSVHQKPSKTAKILSKNWESNKNQKLPLTNLEKVHMNSKVNNEQEMH